MLASTAVNIKTTRCVNVLGLVALAFMFITIASDSNYLLEISVQFFQCDPQSLSLVVNLFRKNNFLYDIFQAVSFTTSSFKRVVFQSIVYTQSKRILTLMFFYSSKAYNDFPFAPLDV